MTISSLDDNTSPGLALDKYRRRILLDEPVIDTHDAPLADSDKATILTGLLHTLIHGERITGRDIKPLPESYADQRRLLRALLNIRSAKAMEPAFIRDLDRLLADEARHKEIVAGADLAAVAETVPGCSLENSDKMVLWLGDISMLKVDAIVNAANDQLLGCFTPLHDCIDNIIHSAAGPMVRQDCKEIMDLQGHAEYTGDAKMTRAYHLPSRFVLHTVGPIIHHAPATHRQRAQLASCYRSCLTLADEQGTIRNIAFPCISTGVFNFPRGPAAGIAVRTVDQWLSANPHHFERVIFNVYSEEDLHEYIRASQNLG